MENLFPFQVSGNFRSTSQELQFQAIATGLNGVLLAFYVAVIVGVLRCFGIGS